MRTHNTSVKQNKFLLRYNEHLPLYHTSNKFQNKNVFVTETFRNLLLCSIISMRQAISVP